MGTFQIYECNKKQYSPSTYTAVQYIDNQQQIHVFTTRAAAIKFARKLKKQYPENIYLVFDTSTIDPVKVAIIGENVKRNEDGQYTVTTLLKSELEYFGAQEGKGRSY